MEQVALTALQVDPMQLLVLGMGLLAIAIVVQAWLHARSTNKLIDVFKEQVDANSKLTAATAKQTDVLSGFKDVLSREQDLREAQIGVMRQLADGLTRHDEKQDTQYKTIIEQIETATRAQVQRLDTLQTDLVGATRGMIDESRAHVAAYMTESFGVIRTGLEQIQARHDEANQRHKADMDAIWDRFAKLQQMYNQNVQPAITGGSSEDTPKQVISHGPDLPDTGLLVDPGERAGSGDTGAAASGDGGAGSAATGGAATSANGDATQPDKPASE